MGQSNSVSAKPSQIIRNLMIEPLFYQWCQRAFWALLTDQVDFENKIKNLLGIDDFTALDTDKKAVKTFNLFLGKPYHVWLEKKAAIAGSVYQYPVPYLDEYHLKSIEILNAAINKQITEVVVPMNV